MWIVPARTVCSLTPPSGDWSATGEFVFIDLVADWGAPFDAFGYPVGYWRYQMVTDEMGPAFGSGSAPTAGSSGHLCNITTEGLGQLDLDLYLAWVDDPTQTVVETQTQAAFVVVGPTGGTGN